MEKPKKIQLIESALPLLKDIAGTLISGNNEATEAPYWMIIDPYQMMKPNISRVANMFTGPFFSRYDAEYYMTKIRPHAFSDKAAVYCCSGHESYKYHIMCKALRIGYANM